VSLEHRYYGKSVPNAPLKYLTSEQAIADLASFHKYITTRFSLNKDTKWIAIGGSYPGMLASFMRIKHPELFHGAICNSGPVQAEVDFY